MNRCLRSGKLYLERTGRMETELGEFDCVTYPEELMPFYEPESYGQF